MADTDERPAVKLVALCRRRKGVASLTALDRRGDRADLCDP
ncbi:hypothetical protein [Nocardia sp. NPDC002869]